MALKVVPVLALLSNAHKEKGLSKKRAKTSVLGVSTLIWGLGAWAQVGRAGMAISYISLSSLNVYSVRRDMSLGHPR